MLRFRILAALMGLLSLTVLLAFFTVHAAVMRPFIQNLSSERANLALYITEQVEAAPDPAALAQDLSARMQLDVEVISDPAAMAALERRRARSHRRPWSIERGGREIQVYHGARTPVAVPLAASATVPEGWVVVRFPVDLDEPPRRIGRGLLLLALVSLLAAWGITRWVLRPLEVAGDAMARIAGGDLQHRLPAGEDVTGRIGETFNRMAEQIAGLVDGQRKLMAAVSHEVRTPLSRLRLHLELLQDAGADPGRLASMEADIAEVDGLIEELLESARLEQGVLALRRAPQRLEALAAEALGSTDLGERPVTLTITPPDAEVLADRARLLRVLSNLLSNVARYTPPDAEVWLRAEATDAGVVLEVADSGPGVPPEALPHLFDPFFRAEGSRSRATGGLGLGLMLVRQIVEAHGGRIQAVNRPQGGLSVEVWLPPASP